MNFRGTLLQVADGWRPPSGCRPYCAVRLSIGHGRDIGRAFLYAVSKANTRFIHCPSLMQLMMNQQIWQLREAIQMPHTPK